MTMQVWKEKKFYPFEPDSADTYLAAVLLENDVFLVVREDGAAIGSDGKTYVNVSREIPSRTIPSELMYIDVRIPKDKIPPDVATDTELETVGWTADADKPVILE